MVKMLICGGRDFIDTEYAYDAFEEFHGACPVTCVISGWANGADTLGMEWAKSRAIKVEAYAPDWDRHGKKAGPIRNQRMLDEGQPDVVMALPGGAGTAHMASIARKAGVEVIQFEYLYFKKEDPKYGFLSNFYMVDQVDSDGVVWPSNEHFYQSRKLLDEKERSLFLHEDYRSPGAAKKLGQKVKIRPEWDKLHRIPAMAEGLSYKYAKGSEMAQRLLDTGTLYLVEWAPWGDVFFGVDASYKGQNWLGRLLMRRRRELQFG